MNVRRIFSAVLMMVIGLLSFAGSANAATVRAFYAVGAGELKEIPVSGSISGSDWGFDNLGNSSVVNRGHPYLLFTDVLSVRKKRADAASLRVFFVISDVAFD